MRWNVKRTGAGTVIQSGIPKGSPAVGALRANGMTLKGVVLTVYSYDSDPKAGRASNSAIYCDVFCYGRLEGLLPQVLVTQTRSGLQEGDIQIPRGSKIDISGPMAATGKSQPANLDGDHVLIGFIEDDIKRPYLMAYIPHPNSDVGHSGDDLGHRMRLLSADGNPRLWKHKGSFWGIDSNGDMIVDLTKAHDGSSYLADGSEPPAPGDGSVGNYRLKLPANSKVEIQIDDGANVTLEDKDGQAKLTLGSGAVSVAVADHLQTLYTQLKSQMDAHDAALQAHTHLYCFGPTGPASAGAPPTLAIGAPAWNPHINSDKAKIPDTD